ncbi:hypothetical protein [Streptococcus thermophilus]
MTISNRKQKKHTPKLQPGALTRGTIRFLSGFPDLDSSAVFS